MYIDMDGNSHNVCSGKRRSLSMLVAALFCTSKTSSAALNPLSGEALTWENRFRTEVDRRLEVPLADQTRYIELVEIAITAAKLSNLPTQAFVAVDRSNQVQAAMIILREANGNWQWLGAVPVSTGKVGKFEHFVTPLGVFAHSLDNPDYRAEGTFNKNNIRGYGLRGRRVFDFGWQVAERGWGNGGTSKMRLQMHATDPTVLEPRLGTVASEGCIRIPATFNAFLDTHGVIDADYETAFASGDKLWILKPLRTTVPWPGRYMVIVDSQASARPAWAALKQTR
jgi:hypothetical protein